MQATAGSSQGLPSVLRRPHLTLRGISVESLQWRREEPSACTGEPRRSLGDHSTPRVFPAAVGGGGSAPRWLRSLELLSLSRLLPRGPTGCISRLLSSAPSRSGSLALFWAVDNPHTRKSCLLGPAHCSSPPPSPLPPPSSLLPPEAPCQLARSQACHSRSRSLQLLL